MNKKVGFTMLVTLKEMADRAAAEAYAVPAFNIFGYEDIAPVVQAAEAMNAPVILAANLVAVKHMPVPYLAPLMLRAAREASVPVCVHLDHGKDLAACVEAIEHGFSSVMYDGSQLPLEDNIRRTKEIADYAHAHGVSVEAEIGSVGYSDPSIAMKHMLSDPDEVDVFVRETGIDAVAISVGTVHRMESQAASIDFDLLQRIQDRVGIPLVIHGSSGVPDDQLRRLTTYRVAKINIGTALRMAFGRTLRDELERKPKEFDRIALFQQPMEAVREAALAKFALLGFDTK
ncbi:putative fructose-bisphosphate aldolase [Paenibacillus solanacearum]|uniref:Fructose-bisphosphate aldolase n=1 Tax=Paenibacillus solanacearum TaxID=2048548 RepID=A0A916K7Y4_9BACL|nr:class II fructose-bisphosphate aldolase [Paenibacillus solanacearum]CAG7642440.1 putative fructose-bisphosphate aldolase [Paenibacillus solanacearum]